MSDKSVKEPTSSESSFIQIREEDVEPCPPGTNKPNLATDTSSAWRPSGIKFNPAFIQCVYDAGRTATVGLLGPNQSGKTQLANYLANRTEKIKRRRIQESQDASPVNHALKTNRALRRTVYPDAYQALCKVSRNGMPLHFLLFFVDTPGHPQQLQESIDMCATLHSNIIMINACAGLQIDHDFLITRFKHKLQRERGQAKVKRPNHFILAFSNIDKLCCTVTRQLAHSAKECCRMEYVSLQLQLHVESLRATFCKSCCDAGIDVSPQTLLCFQDCRSKYCVMDVVAQSSGAHCSNSSSAAFKDVVQRILLDTSSDKRTLVLHFLKDQRQHNSTDHRQASQPTLLYCSPYNLEKGYFALYFHADCKLESADLQRCKDLIAGSSDSCTPMIEGADGNLYALTTAPADSVFFLLVPAANMLTALKALRQTRSIYLPFRTHIRMPSGLISDAMYLSRCFTGLVIRNTQHSSVVEVDTRGEYTLNVFLSILYALVESHPMAQLWKSMPIMTLPLLPVPVRCITHTASKISQFKLYANKAKGTLHCTISMLMRSSPPPAVWGYRLGAYACNELAAVLDPSAPVFDQVATMYADTSYSIVDGTMGYVISGQDQSVVILTSCLTHQQELVAALRLSVDKEVQRASVQFHDLQIVVLDAVNYSDRCSFYLCKDAMLETVINEQTLRYIEPLFYCQLYIHIDTTRQVGSQHMQEKLNALHEMLLARRCVFDTEPWIQFCCPHPSLAVASFCIPAASSLGLEMAIESIIRCTSLHIYHNNNRYFTKTIQQEEREQEDTNIVHGILDALRRRDMQGVKET